MSVDTVAPASAPPGPGATVGRGLRWLAHQIRLLASVRSNPATFVYLFTLIVTSAVVTAAGPQLAHDLLRTQSTNLSNLRHDPVHVLFTSAFWIDGGARPPLLIVPFALVLAPVERWLGTKRAVLVFVSGHVGATLMTAGLVDVQARHGWASRSLTHTIDVGFSYGFVAVAGVLAFRLPGGWRRVFLGLLFAVLVAGIADGATFTDIGHLLAGFIGVGLALLFRRRGTLPRPVGGV